MAFLIEIGPGKIAPGDQRCAGGPEESRSNISESADGRNLPHGVDFVFCKEDIVVIEALERRGTRKRGRDDSRNRRQLVQHRVLHAHHLFRLLHLRFGNRDAQHLEFFGIRESRLDVSQGLKGANHQAGTDKQHQRQRHLHDHQRIARAMPFAAGAEGTSARSQRSGQMWSRVFQDGDRSEQQAREHGHSQRKNEDNGIDSDFGQTRQSRGSFGGQDSNGSVGQPQAQNPAHDSQSQALHQHFARDSSPPGAERGPDREFLLAALGANQQQIRDVRAGDEQNQPDGSHQHPQHGADVPHHLLLQGLEFGTEAGILKQSAVETRRRGPSFDPDPQHASNVGIGLLHGDAGLQARYALIAEIPQKHFVAIESMRKNQFRVVVQEPEILRHHPDDRARLRVHIQVAPDNGFISSETAQPIPVGQNHRVGRTGRVVGLGEPAAHGRLHSHRL